MDVLYICLILQDIVFVLALLLTIVYSILILFIRRFHHRNNIFTLNICSTIISAAVFFIIDLTMAYFDPQTLYAPNSCIILLYAYNIACIGIPFSFITFSVHRLCFIVYYTKPFFNTKRWIVMCIASQWISEFILSLPYIFKEGPVSIVIQILR